MILELENIRLSFASSTGESFKVLDGVNLSIPKGKTTALVGGNGVGKTTLFNVISGFISNYSGKVLFAGKDTKNIPAHRIASLGIGRLFQGRQLMTDLSILDNMKLADFDKTGENPIDAVFRGRIIRKTEEEKEIKARQILSDLFGADSKYIKMLYSPAGTLSYGEQRLVAMARLLMTDYEVLLLDEPTSGVNPKYIGVFGQIIKKMVEERGLTVFLIEHNVNFVRSVADKCAYMSEGKIGYFGDTLEVLSQKEVKLSYLGL